VELDVTYVGAPEYRVRVKAPNYKTAEAQLEESVRRAEVVMEGTDGNADFHRERHTDDE